MELTTFMVLSDLLHEYIEIQMSAKHGVAWLTVIAEAIKWISTEGEKKYRGTYKKAYSVVKTSVENFRITDCDVSCMLALMEYSFLDDCMAGSKNAFKSHIKKLRDCRNSIQHNSNPRLRAQACMIESENVIQIHKFLDYLEKAEWAYENKKEFVEKYRNLLDQVTENFSIGPFIMDQFDDDFIDFIGMEDKIKELEGILDDQGTLGKPRLAYISGIGGSGKSSLAREYARRHKDDYDYKIEISANSFGDVIDKFPLYNYITYSEDEDIVREERLKKIRELFHDKKSLIIIHDYNVEGDPNAKWHMLPSDILITSWNDWSASKKQVSLSGKDLSYEEAVGILKSNFMQEVRNSGDRDLMGILERRFDEDESAAYHITELVDKHPLCLSLIGRQMSWNLDKTVSASKMYAEIYTNGIRLDEKRVFQHKHAAGDQTSNEANDVRKHLEAVFLVALKENRLSKDEIEALRVMRLISPLYGICAGRFERWTRLDCDLLNRLRKLGWIVCDRSKYDALAKDGDSDLGVYYLPMAIEEGIRTHAQMRIEYDDVNIHFLVAYDHEDEHNFYGETQREALLDSARTIAKVVEEENTIEYLALLMKCIHVINYTGLKKSSHEFALQLSLRILAILDKTDRTKLNDVLFYNLAGLCYENVGEYSKALDCKRKTLDLFLQEYRSKNVLTRFHAKINAEIAGLFEKLGAYDTAINYLNASLDICRQQNQHEHEDCANVYFDLGTCYLQKKDYPEALINFEAALKIREKIYGPNDHALLSCHIAMAECYKAMGDQEKHMKHLDALYVIAKIISKKNETGRKKLKERLKEKVGQKLIIDKIKKQKKELKANGGDLSMIRILNEAEVVAYSAFGDKRKALKGLKKLFEESHKEFNEISHEMADKYYIHGIVYRNLGMYEESCSYFKKSWTIYRNVGSIVDDDLKKAYYEYGIAHLLLDRYEEAKAYCEKGIRLDQLDSDHMLDSLYCGWDGKFSYINAEDE